MANNSIRPTCDKCRIELMDSRHPCDGLQEVPPAVRPTCRFCQKCGQHYHTVTVEEREISLQQYHSMMSRHPAGGRETKCPPS